MSEKNGGQFLRPDDNTAAIESLLKDSSRVKCAVAFLGEKAFKIIKSSKATVQIICNLDSGATNPGAVTKLMKLPNVEVRNQPLLHAKVYLADDCAIVSSANISANGLGLEGNEVASWLEAGYKVSDDDGISDIAAWLDEQWESANPISKKDISAAKKKWKKRRDSRPAKPEYRSILDELRWNPSFFKDKEVYFTITRDTRSSEAEEFLEELRVKDGDGKNLDAYENWSELPSNAYFIDLYYNQKNDLKTMGLFYSGDKTIAEKGGSELFLCHKVKSIGGLKLSSSDKKILKSKIAPLNGDNDDAVYLTMETARKRLFG